VCIIQHSCTSHVAYQFVTCSYHDYLLKYLCVTLLCHCVNVLLRCQHTVLLLMFCTAGWLCTRGAADSWQLLHHCRPSNDAERFLTVVPERHRHCLLWHHLLYGWLLRVVSPGVWEQASDASADAGSRTAHYGEPQTAVWVFQQADQSVIRRLCGRSRTGYYQRRLQDVSQFHDGILLEPHHRWCPGMLGLDTFKLNL